ncbi:MAG: hypothetical protein MJZ34_07530 [Paludibacteraceae bacterium]|nr:hypothetical protein [Paludibacteraceae bacterium]
MEIVNKAEFMKLPLGTVWSEAGAYSWQIKTGMRMGALALIDADSDDIMCDNGWDCDYDVDYEDNDEFWVLKPEEIDKVIEKLTNARKQLTTTIEE